MEGPTRILHFTQHGDTSGYFPQLAKWHDRDKYNVFFGTLYPMWTALRSTMDSYDVTCFCSEARGRSSLPLAILKLARFLKQQRIDILHAHLFEPAIVGLMAARITGTKVRVMTRHYSDYHTRIKRTFHTRLDQLSTALSHHVIAVSEHTAKHLIEVENAPREKITTILNGIDFDRLKVSTPAVGTNLRRELGLEDAHVLLICARLHPEKGYEYLFDALPKIRARVNKRVVLLVAGAGTFEKEYRARVAELGCEENVRFLGFREDVPDLMAASDLFVLPSVAEAFGLVLAEALYLGKPVVATRVGGIPEIIDDGVDGVLVPPADSEALSGAVSELLIDDKRRLRMSGAGRGKVERKFKFESMVRSYEAIYEQLLGTNGVRT